MSFKSIVFLSCIAAFVLVAGSVFAVPPDELPAPVWVDCFNGGIISTCNESVTFDFKAVIPGREHAQGLIRYRLLHGPGELNEMSGRWIWFPQPSDTLVTYDVAVQAYIRHTDIVNEKDCEFVLHVRNSMPRLLVDEIPLNFTLYPVFYVDAPGLKRLPLRVVERDSCETPVVDLFSVEPTPSGQVYVENSESLVADLDEFDHGQKFVVTLRVTSGPDTVDVPLILETRRHVVPRFVACPDTIAIAPGAPASVDLRAVDPDFDDNSLGIRYQISRVPRPGPLLHYDYATGKLTVSAPLSTIGQSYDFTAVAIYGDDTTATDQSCRFHVVVADCLPIQIVTPPDGITIPVPIESPYIVPVVAESQSFYCGSIRYFIESVDPEPDGAYRVNETDGDFNVYFTAEDAGRLFHVRIGATYQSHTSFATYVDFYLQAEGSPNPLRVEIQGPPDSVEQGTHFNVDVAVTEGNFHLNGFELLMQWDAAAMSFQQATPGDLFDECDWEYFTFRYGYQGSCGDTACPAGTLRVIGIAETNNGDHHPTCFDLDKPFKLFSIDFLLTDDRTYKCQALPIRFVWYDCGDNAMAIKPESDPNPYAQQLIVSNRVYDWEGVGGDELTDNQGTYPTIGGATDTCLSAGIEQPVRMIDFVNGGIDVACADTIDVLPPYLRVSIAHVPADHNPCYNDPPETPVSVKVTVDEMKTSINGFDLFFGYHDGPLRFIAAAPGPVFDACAWEYFTYRSETGTEFPVNRVRVVGVMDINNGDVHPSCFRAPAPFTLFTLEFMASNDPKWECVYLPIRFFWTDCGDNAVSVFPSPNGDLRPALALSREVYEFPDFRITDTTETFPTLRGAPSECFSPSLTPPVRAVDFVNGGFDRVCSDSLAYCIGDLNINGIPNELADYELFRRYFVYGDTVFGGSPRPLVTATSDVNRDGIPLSPADYVYQRRIIAGDALPYHFTPPDTVIFNRNEGAFALASPLQLGAVWVKVPGNVFAESFSDEYELLSNYHDGYTSILLEPKDFSGAIVQGDLFGIQSLDTVTIEAATYEGAELITVIQAVTGISDNSNPLPKDFAVAQNFPNPFNLETVIPFDLPHAAEVEFEIYNVLGKLVYRHTGQYAAGRSQIAWDGRNSSGQVVASGMYYYRLTAGDRSITKKMLLLK